MSFESKHGPLRYETIVFPHWHDNLRAIALGLEALRKVDRYGITKSGEQYTGWRQLGTGSNDGPTDPDEARTILASFSDFAAAEVEDGQARAAYRQALKRTHPDVGGDPAHFAMVRRAGQLLGVGS